MKKTRKRHSWLENAVPVDSFPHEVYKISKCKKCGMLRLHGLQGNTYSKKYVLGDLVFDEMPECEPKSENQ